LAGVLAIGFVMDEEVVASPDASLPAPAPGAAGAAKLVFAVVARGVLRPSDLMLLVLVGAATRDPRAIPLLWIAVHVGKSLAAVVGGRLADRSRPIVVVLLANLALAVALLALANGAPTLVFVVAGSAVAFGEGAEKRLIADAAPAARRGRSFGAFHVADGVGALIAGLVLGFVADLHGASTSLTLAAAGGLVGALAFLVVTRRPSAPRAAAR
jgi:sugar phosphate permease